MSYECSEILTVAHERFWLSVFSITFPPFLVSAFLANSFSVLQYIPALASADQNPPAGEPFIDLAVLGKQLLPVVADRAVLVVNRPENALLKIAAPLLSVDNVAVILKIYAAFVDIIRTFPFYKSCQTRPGPKILHCLAIPALLSGLLGCLR